MAFILQERKSIANQFIAELRSVEVQKDRLRFRHNLERIGEILAYEISKTMDYEESEIDTPLGSAEGELLRESPVLIPIIRAGMPMLNGMLRFFDQADCGFIGAYRKMKKSGVFEIEKKYTAVPPLHEKEVIVLDPMLATGRSAVLACKDLLANYSVRKIHIAAIIASEEGIEHVKAYLPDAH